MSGRVVNFYAIRDLGIFQEWQEVEEALKGRPDPIFKSFRTLSAAQAYLAGWDAGTPDSLSQPFGFAGPTTLPPVPSDKLGLPFSERVARERRKRPAAQAVAQARPSAFASLVPPNPTPSTNPGSWSALPLPSPGSGMPASSSPAPSIRKRSPLIQSVVEEAEENEEEEIVMSNASSGSSDEQESGRSSRSHSVSSVVSREGRRKSFLGLGFGSLKSLSTVSPLSPPASPETAIGPLSGRQMVPPAPVLNEAMFQSPPSLQRPSVSVLQSPSPIRGPNVPLHSPLASPLASPRALQPSLTPDLSSDSSLPLSTPDPNQSPDTAVTDPFAAFTASTAPVFSRSSSSLLVLPVRSPSSSSASLHRNPSKPELRQSTSVSSLASMASATSRLEAPKPSFYGRSHSSSSGSLSPSASQESLQPPPPNRYGSSSSRSSLRGSIRSVDLSTAQPGSPAVSGLWSDSVAISVSPPTPQKEKSKDKENKEVGKGWKGKMKKMLKSKA